MAEINSYPNNSDEYIGAEEVMRWHHGRTKGVFAGDGNAAVSAVSGEMQVQVAAGIGWITDADDNGICWWFDSPITLLVDAAESTGTLNRIDRVIVEWQTTDYAALPEVKILKGTDRSVATAPALTNTSSLRQMSLAQISIPAGTTQLTALNVTDERMDETVCGIVTETVTADTSTIVAQYEEALEQLLTAISQAWDGTISDGAITNSKLANGAVSTGKLATGAVTAAKLNSSVFDAIYPVGAIYMSAVETSPASLFGGTWEQIKDKFLLSAGDTYSAGGTGGSATHTHTTAGHTLTVAEIPSHTHNYVRWGYNMGQSLNVQVGGEFWVGGRTAATGATGSGGSHSHGDTGSSSSLPPYLAVYVWKRVA